MDIYEQDPDEIWPYSFDWSGWLVEGDTITASVWTVVGPTGSSPTFDDTTTTIHITGGDPGTQYDIVNTVDTAQGFKGVDKFGVVMIEKGN